MSLFDSNNKGVKFANIGDSVTGTITQAPYERQQTKFGTQDFDFWPNGEPKMQVLVPLQTDIRENPNDDGARTLYVASKNLKKAIGEAIRAANVGDVSMGGVLTVQYVGNDPASKNPANPAKLYQAQYTPPSTPLAAPAAPPIQQAPQPVPSAPVAQQPPFQPAPAAAPAHGLNQDQIGKLTQLRAAQIPDDTIATAIGATSQQLAQYDATPF